jgi:hypothetical protein
MRRRWTDTSFPVDGAPIDRRLTGDHWLYDTGLRLPSRTAILRCLGLRFRVSNSAIAPSDHRDRPEHPSTFSYIVRPTSWATTENSRSASAKAIPYRAIFTRRPRAPLQSLPIIPQPASYRAWSGGVHLEISELSAINGASVEIERSDGKAPDHPRGVPGPFCVSQLRDRRRVVCRIAGGSSQKALYHLFDPPACYLVLEYKTLVWMLFCLQFFQSFGCERIRLEKVIQLRRADISFERPSKFRQSHP